MSSSANQGPAVVKTEQTICPFCKTALNEGATVCAACGARKGTAAEKGVAGYFMIWANTRGVFLLVWVVFLPMAVLGHLATGHWQNLAIALSAFIAGWWVNKWTRWLWIKIMGNLSDPVWYRS